MLRHYYDYFPALLSYLFPAQEKFLLQILVYFNNCIPLQANFA
jgi:hypothetical protein